MDIQQAILWFKKTVMGVGKQNCGMKYGNGKEL